MPEWIDSLWRCDAHTPLFVDFQVPSSCLQLYKWQMPASWAEWPPAPHDFHNAYLSVTENQHLETQLDKSTDLEHNFQVWSPTVEKAVHHAFISDEHSHQPCRPHRVVKRAWEGAFQPPCESLSLRSHLRVCQVRRLQGLLLSIKAIGRRAVSLDVFYQHMFQWRADGRLWSFVDSLDPPMYRSPAVTQSTCAVMKPLSAEITAGRG